MTESTGWTGPSFEICPVAQSALCIESLCVPVTIGAVVPWSGVTPSGGGVSRAVVVAPFAADASGLEYPDIEAGVAPWAAELAMAGLTGCQPSLGIETVDEAVQVNAINGMWQPARPVDVAGGTVETRGKTARGRLPAPQILAMAGDA